MSVLVRHIVPTSVVGSGRGRRTQGVTRSPLRAGGGFARSSFFLAFNDLGAGVVDTMEGRGQVAPSFTRATTAWTKLSTGLWAQVASGVPRSTYLGATTAVGAYVGYLAEGARTNLALQNRDMTQAAWVAVNVTPAKNAVGIDGVSNSATTLTSGAIGGSILQTETAAASSRTYSVWLRRVSGSGTITISQGATTLDVTASLNTSTFTRVELAASVLNSAYGITFGASGDVIVADMNQFEAGAFASAPIPTTVAAVTRNADVLTYPLTSWFNATAGSMISRFGINALGSALNVGAASISDNTTNERYFLGVNDGNDQYRWRVVDGGADQADIMGGAYISGLTSMAGAYAINDFAMTANGVLIGSDSSGTLPTVTQLNIGNAATSGAGELFGPIRSFSYWPQRLSNGQLQALTS